MKTDVAILAAFAFAAVVVIELAGCTSQTGSGGPFALNSPTARNVSADIAQACELAQPYIAGSAVLEGACSANGMIQMTINDTLPVGTPLLTGGTNSGNSAAWVLSERAKLKAAS